MYYILEERHWCPASFSVPNAAASVIAIKLLKSCIIALVCPHPPHAVCSCSA